MFSQARLSVSFFVLFGATLAVPNSNAQDDPTCKRLLSAHDAGRKPTHKELTVDEQVKIEMTRACLKSYSSGFPGGEEAFLKADSKSLRKDLDNVEELFKQYKGGAKFAGDKSDSQHTRKLHIELGWDREQVLLWGNYFYIFCLYREGNYERVVSEVERVRKTFGLSVRPLTSWDDQEQLTYYSRQSLRNLIALIDYRAQNRMDADDSDLQIKLAKDFIAARPAFLPFLKEDNDPTAEIIRPVCGGQKP